MSMYTLKHNKINIYNLFFTDENIHEDFDGPPHGNNSN